MLPSMEVPKPLCENEKASPELADVFRLHGKTYRESHSLQTNQLRVMFDIEACRTAELGGHLYRCDACGFERELFNSCRNRHCPKCQALAKAKWLEDRKAELLPVPYFHSVFTLPHQLNLVVRCNQRVVLDILFLAVSETIQKFAQNELGGTLGFIAALHTWNQKLLEHYHIHCLIPGGALAFDETSWIPTQSDTFLFNVEALGIVFRGKFLAHLKKAYETGKLVFPDKIAPLGSKAGFQKFIDELYAVNWVVYAKPPFSSPEKVLDYLARYVHRVAISNNRILDVRDGVVLFSYRDRNNNDKLETMPLDADEFIRRFLLHVLPDGYMRIRSFGFLSNSVKKRQLSKCRKLLHTSAPPIPEKKSLRQRLMELTGVDPYKCPKCDTGELVKIAELPKLAASKLTHTAEEKTTDTS